MVRIHHQLDRFQEAVVNGFYGILKIILSLALGFIVAKCSIFENFSPFSLILLSVSPDIALIPTFCYLGSTFGILSEPFNLSVFKYITALTMIYVIYMVFRKSLKIVKKDTAILSAASCFVAGFLFLLAEQITLFNTLILIGESVLVCCCIYFISYAVRGFKQCCYLSSRELISAVITMVLILIALHNVYLFSLSIARIVALSILFLSLCCLKTSHVAVLGSCLGIILAAVANGGEAVFTAIVVGTLAGCVFSSFSERFSLISFILVYYTILFFFGKFPWNYWYFSEPLVAYAAVFFVPKKRLRVFLSSYIAVKSNKKKKEHGEIDSKLVMKCQRDCEEICPKAQICYQKNLDELTECLDSSWDRFAQTNELGDLNVLLPFCIKPNAMKEIIKRHLIRNSSHDFDDLIEQLDHLSKKIEQKMNTSVEAVRFLGDEEQKIRSALEKRRLIVNDINFFIDERKCKRCDIQFTTNGALLHDKIISEVVAPYFSTGITLKTIKTETGYNSYIKECSRYEISCAALCKTRSGEQISGDTALGFSVGRDQYYLILADGMGSGKEAGLQSTFLINTLRRLLSGGLTVTNALNVYHSAARFRQENYFTTVDICSIGLNDGIVDFYKAGAFDSFHLRENKVSVIKGGGLPLGLKENDKIQHCTLTVKENDYLILASDGLSTLQEELNTIIPTCCSTDARSFAKNILRTLGEKCENMITDDITVMVCKFNKRKE